MNVRTIVGQEVKALWGGGKGTPLTTVTIGYGLLIGARMIYPVIIPYLQTAHGLSLTIAGLLVTTLWLFYSFGQLPGGMLADTFDERTLMAVSILIVAAALALVVSAPNTLILFVGTAIWGLATSLYSIARVTYLSNLYPDRLGSALGVTMASADLGQTIIPPVATILAVGIVWQAGLGFVIPLLILSGTLVLVTVPTNGEKRGSLDTQSLCDTLEAFTELRSPAMRNVILVMFLYFFVWQSFTAFYPTYLISIKGISPSVASVLFGFFFAVGVLVKPIAGMAYDRIGVRISLICILFPPTVGFFLLPVVNNVWALFVITALISVMLGSGVITQTYLTDSFADEVQGTGLGGVKSFTVTFAAGGPVLFGIIADNGYLVEGYGMLAVLLLVVILFTLRMESIS